jgi:ABC-type maltose transport system permease subunit
MNLFWKRYIVVVIVAALLITFAVSVSAQSKSPLGLLFDGYKFNKQKVIGLSVMSLGAAFDGAVEGYEFDGRTSFERKFGASKEGFWGSQSWRRAYTDGDPEKGFKSGFDKWSGAFDFYHTADDVRKIGYICGGVTFGIGAAKSNRKFRHWLLDTIIISTTTSVFKSASMRWVRK